MKIYEDGQTYETDCVLYDPFPPILKEANMRPEDEEDGEKDDGQFDDEISDNDGTGPA
jgi:hypothetical protein